MILYFKIHAIVSWTSDVLGSQKSKGISSLEISIPKQAHTVLVLNYLGLVKQTAEQRTIEIPLPLAFAAQTRLFWNNQSELFGCFGFQ